jgi:uncharacterized protein YxjI
LKRDLQQNNKIVDFRLNLTDGKKKIPIEISAKYFDGGSSVHLTITDISKLIELEQRIQNLEES